ncbi:Lsr2 family protein [Kineosporia mesophila]|uniref:Lsr2 family protein n=1 Tax=Kineosporia mesophila TaxID=566012 RepID=A0ABP6ZCG0_9ACTN|nr:Lsr2 family protein [Kineosporia mesophila]MCD5350191.1 Lsr2 family protein [Kineosporia mesophila]
MATRTVTELLDDMTGQQADETVAFSIDGVEYEIDMTKKNAAALRKAFAPWQDAARRVGGRKQSALKQVSTGVDNRAVRAWAASNGYELSERGRIPAHVIEQYQAAGN